MGGTDANAAHELHIAGESSLMILITTMLICGGVCRFISKKYHLPYTPILLTLGVVLSYMIENNINALHDGYKLFLKVDPHGLLSLLVPIILFEPGLNSKIHHLKKIAW